jgi:hypothetical protein
VIDHTGKDMIVSSVSDYSVKIIDTGNSTHAPLGYATYCELALEAFYYCIGKMIDKVGIDGKKKKINR